MFLKTLYNKCSLVSSPSEQTGSSECSSRATFDFATREPKIELNNYAAGCSSFYMLVENKLQTGGEP